MAKGHENLIPVRTEEEAREKGRRGGKASGEARRKKRDFRLRFQQAMEMQADPNVAAAMAKTGVPIDTNYDVIVAGILKGVMKNNPAMVKEAMRLLGEDEQLNRQKELLEIEKAKAELEMERIRLANEKERLWIEAVKANQGQIDELPDDGFLDALKGSAVEDWSNEDI